MHLTQYLDLPRLQNVSPRAVIACAALFTVGMALLGSVKVAGLFYILSLVLGLYLLWRLPRIKISLPPAVKLYLVAYGAFLLLVVAHIVIFSASTSHIDQASRIGLGVLNGFVFLALFGFSREKLFQFIVLVAGAQASIAIAVAIYQGLDFTNFTIATRARGVTNPIPFSEMLFTSVGLVAIALAGRMEKQPAYRELVILGSLLAVGVLAVVLTGTRGTLVAFAALIFLIMIPQLGKVPLRQLLAFGTVVVAGGALAASLLFAREPVVASIVDFIQGAPVTVYAEDSVGVRFQLWTYGLDLIGDAPLFGHGLDSYPQVLQRPEFGLPADSRLFKFSNVHNQYIDMVMKTGLVGAVVFFMPLAIALVLGLRAARDPRFRSAGLAIMWVGGSYAIYGLTQTFYGHASTALHYGVFLGMLLWVVAPGGSYGDIRQEPDTVL